MSQVVVKCDFFYASNKHTSKRYKKGAKSIQGYIATIESSLDDGGAILGTEPWVTASPILKRLISNPMLENIEEDNSI